MDVPIDSYRVHVPSLRAVSAVAARRLLDIRSLHAPADYSAYRHTRGRLPTQLLDWLDDLYDDLTETNAQRVRSTDALWLLPGGSLPPSQSRLQHTCPRLQLPLLVSLYAHIRFDRITDSELDSLQRCLVGHSCHVPNDIFPYTVGPALESVYLSLIRGFGADSPHLTRLTRHFLSSRPFPPLRQALSICDPLYQQRFDMYRAEQGDRLRPLYCALVDNDLANALSICVHAHPSFLLSYLRLCIREGDAEFLDNVLSAVDIQAIEDYHCDLLFAAAAALGDVNVLKVIIDRMHPKVKANDVWAEESVWYDVSGVACAELLVQKGYMYEDAIHHCTCPRVISYLLQCGGYSRCPRVREYEDTVVRDVELIRAMRQAWDPPDDEVLSYLRELIDVCSAVDVLREVVRTAFSLYPVDPGRSAVQRSLDWAFLNSLKKRALLVECVRLGANVNVVHVENGQTMLIAAAADKRHWCVDLMLNVGCNARVRNNRGKMAIDLVYWRGDWYDWLPLWTMEKLKIASK